VLARTRYRGEGGFVFEYHGISVKSRFPNAPYSQLHNLLSWNASGLKTTYTGNLHLKNVRIIGDFSNDLGARLGTQGGNNDLIENFRVDGFLRGMALPSHSVVSGGFFGALIGIPIGSAQGTTIDLKDMKFGTVPSTLDRSGSRGRAVVAGQIQYDLYAPPIFTGRDFNPSTAFAARPPTYVRSHPNFPQGAELYSLEQMPDFVLPDFGIPGLLDGKTTTREAWETHRLVPGGGMAPPGTVPFPRSNVLVGAPTQRDSSVPARAARREAQGRVAGQYQGTVSAQPERTREQRSAERAARRPVQDSGGRPVQDPAAATRRSRTNRQNPPSEVARGAPETRNSAGNTLSASTGQTWTLVPQAGGRSLLVANGQRPRLPLVDAGTDQRVMLAEGAALQGVVATGASSHWSRAYGPGTVAFADPNNPQTRAKFSAPGTYVLHLTVQDQASLKNTAPVTITVMQSP